MNASVKKGLFITVDGLDCAGKTTGIELLATRLRAEGNEVQVIHGNWGDPFNEALTNVIKNTYTEINHSSQAFVFLAMRYHMLTTMIIPALEKGITVIVDRWTTTTKVYQNKASTLIDQASYLIGIDNHIPDLSLYIRVPEDTYIQRKQERGNEHACVFEDHVRALYNEWTGYGVKAIADLYARTCHFSEHEIDKNNAASALGETHVQIHAYHNFPNYAAIVDNEGSLEEFDQKLFDIYKAVEACKEKFIFSITPKPKTFFDSLGMDYEFIKHDVLLKQHVELLSISKELQHDSAHHDIGQVYTRSIAPRKLPVWLTP